MSLHSIRLLTTVAISVLVLVAFGSIAGCGSFTRWQGNLQQTFDRQQTLLNAQNQVQVNDIQIAQTRQLVEVEKQKAQIKVAEAQGIAQAQKIINGTLTPLYLQHEAIDAQLEAAKNSSHTETIYVPAGPQGIPMVFAQPAAVAPK